jgi:hypothetical protein
LAAVALAQSASLARRPQAGDELRYRTTMRLTQDGMAVLIEGDWRERVVRAGTDGGWTVEQSLSGVSLEIGGQKIRTEDAAITTIEYFADGLIKSFSRDRLEVEDLRLARSVLTPAPAGPVERGAEWTREAPADPASKAPPVRYRLRLDGTERWRGLDTHRLRITNAETAGDRPISVEGQAWLRASDGALVRRVVTIKNAPVGAGGAPADLEWTLELAR